MACNLSTGRMKFLFTGLGILLLSSVSMGKTGPLRCPPLVQVELGTDGVIKCDIGFKFANLYWYSGDTFSETPPIVRLENGETEGGDGFDITANGSLVILNSDISREGIYTIVVFHLNNTYEYSSSSLKTFANPKPHFPLIQQCSGRQICSLKADYKRFVQCSIHGARPAFDLELVSDGVTLKNVTRNNVTDANTGLTDTFIKANYESAECVQLSKITCIASGSAMQEIGSTLTLHDDCLPINPTNATGKGSAGVAVVAVVISLVIIALIVVTVIVFIKKRRNDYQQVKQIDVTSESCEKSSFAEPQAKPDPLSPQGKLSQIKVTHDDNEYANGSQENKTEDGEINDKRKALLRELSKKYRADYFGNIKNDDDRIISIDDVYIDLEFEVKDENGVANSFKINHMLTEPFQNDKKSKLFLPNKMQLTFSSYFAYIWSEQTTKKNILLVVNMRDVSYSTSIVAAVKEMLQDKLPLNNDELMKVFEKFGCHIILDGVDVKHIVGENKGESCTETATNDECEFFSKWTIAKILRERETNIVPKTIVQWIIVYDREIVQSTHSIPYNVVQIKEIPMSFIKQFDNYIDTVVDYYCRRCKDAEEKEIRKMVQEVISQCELKKKFERAPVLLMQMTHLVTRMCLNNADISTAAGIGPLIIQSLSLLKMRYLRKLSVNDAGSLTSVEEKLGEAAFNQMDGKANVGQHLPDDMIKFCKSIGLIMKSSSAELILFSAEHVKFFVTASFLKNKKNLDSFLDQAIKSEGDAESNARFHIVPFVCALQPSYCHKICEKVLKSGRMNFFLDCFCETTNADELHGVIKKYLEKESHPITIYNHKPHLVKIRRLLRYCKIWKITVSRIKFEKVSQAKFNTTFVKAKEFEMPAVEKITFHNISLDEEEIFMYYIEWIMGLNVKTVSFDECKLPELSTSVRNNLQSIFSQNKSKVLITRIESQDDTVSKSVLNKKDVEWEKSADKPIKKKEPNDGHPDTKKSKGNITDTDFQEKQSEDTTKDYISEKPPGTEPTESNFVEDKSGTVTRTPPLAGAQAINDKPLYAENKNSSGKTDNTHKDKRSQKITLIPVSLKRKKLFIRLAKETKTKR